MHRPTNVSLTNVSLGCCAVARVSAHVWQLATPTVTLPPSMTTNTYLIVANQAAIVVDIGSAQSTAIDAVVDTLHTLGAQRVVAIVATHGHRDHTDGIFALAARCHAPIFVHPLDAPLVAAIKTSECKLWPPPERWSLSAVQVVVEHRPGHTHGHLHLRVPEDKVVLVGDHLAGEGSVWIGPPDGHMADYYRALTAIIDGDASIAGPGHGQVLTDATQAARDMVVRRRSREDAILHHLADGARTRTNLYSLIYGAIVPDGARRVAERTLLAHLLYLVDSGVVDRTYRPGIGFLYRVCH